MPHITVEYSANLKPDARIPALLKTIHEVLLAQDGVFLPGAIRSRAIELAEFRVADGAEDDAFVHVVVEIAGGRAPDVKKRAFDQLFDAIKAHFADVYARRSLALSMDIREFGEAGTYKHNNIHARFRKA
jgi:5-carboxymethyl-2-hydroxymuconate isomerase